LIFNRAIPVESERFQGAQHFVGASGNDPRGIEIFYTHQPTAAGLAGIEETSDGCNQGPEV